MGGGSTSSTQVQNQDIYSRQHNMQDQGTRIHNAFGKHNIDVGSVGDGGTIYLLNLQQNGNLVQAQTLGEAQVLLI